MRTACLFALVLLALFASYPASATSYVPVTDEALVDQAPVVAVVEVQDSGAGPENPRPSTVYRVRVERVVKGAMASGLVIRVRVPAQAFTVFTGMPANGTAHLIVDVNGWFE